MSEKFDKNVLLTGGAGFIGSHVASLFVHKYPNYRIVVLDALTHCANLKNLEKEFPCSNFKFIKGNICSQDLVSFIFKEYSIDTVLHFAAETHVDHSFGQSFDFAQTNVIGTSVLLDCAKKAWDVQNASESQMSNKLFLHVSTDEIYGESEMDKDDEKVCGFDEQALYTPTNPYAATKAAAEMIVLSYWRSFKMPIIISRSNNVFGPRQFPEKMIPKFINLLNRGQKLCVHGTGMNMRTYIHAQDIATAFDTLVHKGSRKGDIYNIGSGNELRNIQVVRALLKIFGKTEQSSVQFVRDRAFNDARYLINYDKILKLGWTPRFTFMEGLIDTVKWYCENSDSFWKNLDEVLVAHPIHKPASNEAYAENQETLLRK